MSSSDDDAPLAGRKTNGHETKSRVSSETVPRSAMAKESSSGHVDPGISLRMGEVEEMDIDSAGPNGTHVNGVSNGKRRARASGGKNYKESSSDEDDDKPLSKRRRVSNGKGRISSDSDDEPLIAKSTGSGKKSTTVLKKPAKVKAHDIGEDSDSDTPLGAKLIKEKGKIEKSAEKEAKQIRKREKSTAGQVKKEENSDDDDLPLAKRKKSVGTPSKSTSANGVGKKTKVKTETPKKEGKSKKSIRGETEDDVEAEMEEEEYRWWEDPTKGDGTKKWSTLQHNGVVFPPAYEPLPTNVKMRYDGKPVTLQPDAEEVAGFFGAMLNSTHNVENPTFQKNFFHDFQEVLKETGGAKDEQGNKVKIAEFKKCDFSPIFDYYEAKRAEKKAMSTAEKKAAKAEKDAVEGPFMYCLWDGRKEKVGNFRVEPPGLFRGRGEHPKTGKVKKRVMPEQITINIGEDATVPTPPEGHRWKEIKHDHEGTWLAMWQENINGAYKYVMLAANSSIKGQSDFNKFEKARELKKHIDRIRKDYTKGLKAELMADRQRATAVYLIDQFALRAGNEKGEDEADTVGCCSLKFEHVTLKPPNKVIFDFLGKDSIRFYDEVEVDPQVFKNLKIFKKAPKKDGDEIFDRLTTTQLNKHLGSYMTGLSAKVFRTYNASYTMSKLLRDMKSTGTIPEKVKDYNEANRKVAILCNHKRTVPATHENTMEKMAERIKAKKYQKWRYKQQMLQLEPKLKKQKGAEFFELDDDMDEEWVKQHQEFLVQETRQKIEKKFAKDNEKLAAEGEKEMKPKELEERLRAADEEAKKYQKENKTKKIEPEGRNPSIEKLEASIAKTDQQIENMLIQAEDRENNKEVALGTSKINYIDPRLTVVFSKKFNVPIERFFSKTLREKFAWAINSVDEDWEF